MSSSQTEQAPQAGTVTVEDLRAATGVSRQTLIRWAEKGLIPTPTRARHGHGWQGRWPAWVLKRVEWVRDSLQNGNTLEDVGRALAMFGQSTIAERSRWAEAVYAQWAAQRSVLRPTSKRLTVLDDYAQLVNEMLAGFSVGAQTRKLVAVESIFKENVVGALISQKSGAFPILVFDGVQANVTADFAVGMVMCRASEYALDHERRKLGLPDRTLRGNIGAWVVLRLTPLLMELCALTNVDVRPPEELSGGMYAPPLVWVGMAGTDATYQYQYSITPTPRDWFSLRLHEDTGTVVPVDGIGVDPSPFDPAADAEPRQ